MRESLSRRLRLWVLWIVLILPVCGLADTPVSGSIWSDTTWRAADSPFIVTSDVIVESNVTLTIEAGSDVQFHSGRILGVYGTLNAIGSTRRRISFEKFGSEPSGGRLHFAGAGYGLSATGRLVYCNISEASGLGIATLFTDLTMENCTISDIQGTGIFTDRSRVSIINNEIHDTGEGLNALSSAGVIGTNRIYNIIGNADAIDIDLQWAGSGDSTMTLSHNVVSNGMHSNSDGIDLGSATVTLVGNHISHFGDKGISVGEDSTPEIYNNFVKDCVIGIAIKDGSTPVAANNTIVDCTYGIDSYAKRGVIGGRGSLINSIIWDCDTGIRLQGDSTLDVQYSDIEGAVVWPGISNIMSHPLFIAPASGDYSLDIGSRCVDAGSNMAWAVGVVDIEGDPRVQGGSIDMGAYETAPIDGRALRVLNPQGSASIEIGTPIQIEWGAYGTNWLGTETVSLQISTNSGVIWSNLAGAQSLDYDTGSQSWGTADLTPGTQYRVQVVCNSETGVYHSTASDFSLVQPALDHFQWSAIASPQWQNSPISVTLSALSSSSNLVRSFAGPVDLRAMVAGSMTGEVVVGVNDGRTWTYPMAATYHDVRTQQIFLTNEVGTATTIGGLTMNVTSLPGIALQNWTIRMRHTSLAEYSTTPAWESTEWTTVYQSNETISTTGPRTFMFTQPFKYNGTDNLMVDFSFNNSSSGSFGYTEASPTPTAMTVYYRTYSSYGDPLTWTGTTPYLYRTTYRSDVTFVTQVIDPIPISPTNTGVFSSGIWSGTVILDGVATQAVMEATAGLVRSSTTPFDILAASPLLLSLPASIDEGSSAVGSVTLSATNINSVTVTLESLDTSEAVVPNSVTIPAGSSNAQFSIAALTDGLLDGTQRVEISASAMAYARTVDWLTVQDIDTAVLGVSLPVSAREGDGTLVGQGSVSIDRQAVGPFDVQLYSGDSTELTVPSTVTIRAGQTTALFDVTVVDDGEIDGAQTAHVAAQYPTWTSASNTMTIMDNEGTNLLVMIGSLVSESAGSSTNIGTVSIAGTLPYDLSVSLASSDPEVVAVTDTVVIVAGEVAVQFGGTVVDDLISDGAQTALIIAQAAGMGSASGTVTVADDELHHFVVSDVPFSQAPRIPFAVSIRAAAIDDLTISSYRGAVDVALQGDEGPIPLAITQGPLTNQGVVSLQLSADTIGTGVVVIASDGAATGTSSTFVVSGPRISVSFSTVTNVVVTNTTKYHDIHVYNTGDRELNFFFTGSGGWARLLSTNGTLAPGRGRGTLILLDAAGLTPDTLYERTIGLTCNDPTMPSTNLLVSMLTRHPGQLNIVMPLTFPETAGVVTGYVTIDEPVEGGSLEVALSLDADSSDLRLSSSRAFVEVGGTNAEFRVVVYDNDDLTGPKPARFTATASLHRPGDADVMVLDDEIALVEIRLPEEIDEGSGPQQDTGIVFLDRVITEDLPVFLTSSDTNALAVPASVVIQAGSVFASFSIEAPNNEDPGWATAVEVTCTVPGWPEDVDTITVNDDDELDLDVAVPRYMHEKDGFHTGTVSLNAIAPVDTVIVLSSSHPEALGVVPSVVIEAGQSNVSFIVTVYDDDVPNGKRYMSITASAPEARMGSYPVTLLDDDGVVHYVSPDGGHVSPFLSWADASTNIQEAVWECNTYDRVLVTNGVYDQALWRGSRSALSNVVTIRFDMLVESVNGPEHTFIVGHKGTEYGNWGSDAVRCVEMSTGTLRGFTLTNGHTASYTGDAWSSYGGGVFALSGARVENCVIVGCSSVGMGGGAWGGVFSNCVISANYAGSRGGGIFVATAYDCVISNNFAISRGGGASSCELERCVIVDNVCGVGRGGGLSWSTVSDSYIARNAVSNYYGGGVSYCDVFNCVIEENRAPHGAGGENGTMVDCTIRDNVATEFGGGLCMVVASNCVVSGNSAPSGGGSEGSTLVRCTLIDNAATNVGGGSYNDILIGCVLRDNYAAAHGGGAAGAYMINCTVVDNRAEDEAGGIFRSAAFNSVIYSNSAATDADSSGSFIMNGCAGSLPLYEHSVITNDPCFLEFSGGDLRLTAKSPCIDAGTNYTDALARIVPDGIGIGDTNLTLSLLEMIPADLTPYDGDGDGVATPDIGAYEFVPGITLYRPADGDRLLAGAQITVAWSNNVYMDTVDIDLLTGSVAVASLGTGLSSPIPGDSQLVLIPADTAAGDYFLRVSEGTNPLIYGVSGPFAVVPVVWPHLVTVTNRLPTFTWAEGNDAELYRIWLNRDGTNYCSAWSSTNAWMSDTLLKAGTYSWWVRPWADGDFIGEWSEAYTFDVPEVVPGAVVPGNPRGVQMEQPRFQWTVDLRADSYELSIAYFGSVYRELTGVVGNSFMFGEDFLPGQYTWRARAVSADGAGPWCDDTAFVIAPAESNAGPSVTHYVSPSGGNVPPFLSWSDAAIDIQSAVDVANAGDRVLVASGVYDAGGRPADGMNLTNVVTILRDVLVESVGGSGETYILGLAGSDYRDCGDDARRCVYMQYGTIRGFTLTNGHGGRYGSGAGRTDTYGGCMYGSSTAVVDNCVIVGGVSPGGGGGIYGGTVSNSVITGNTAWGNGGGAYDSVLYGCIVSNNYSGQYGGGASYSDIRNCEIVDNFADSSGGGAADGNVRDSRIINNIAGYDGGGLDQGTASNCWIEGNSLTEGGEGGGLCTVDAIDCTIVSNTADQGGGGAFMTGTNCLFYGNTANYEGGGLYESFIARSTIRDNESSDVGGGVANTICRNSLIVGNSSDYGGGGAYYATLDNCTVVRNSSTGEGGGTDGCEISNSIVYYNTAPTSPDISGGNSPRWTNVWYSCSTTGIGDAGNITNAPLFVDLAGGDYRLTADSPGIDAGMDLSALYSWDIGGDPRPVDGDDDGTAMFDMGAYEFVPTFTVIRPAAGSSAVPGADLAVEWMSVFTLGRIDIELIWNETLLVALATNLLSTNGVNSAIAVLPADTAPGTNYTVRIVQTDDSLHYADSEAFTVNSAWPHAVTISNRRPAFLWQPVGTPEMYYIWLKRNGSDYYTSWTPSTTWPCGIALKGGSYTWWVRPWASGDFIGPWSDTYSFDVTTMVPGQVATRQPTGTITVVRPTFEWDATRFVETYRIWVKREGEDFSSGDGLTGTSLESIIDLPLGDYTWWIKGVSIDGEGPWSAPAAFTVHSFDVDTDGMLDEWERKHWGDLSGTPSDDPDGDRQDNLSEFRSDTDPTNPASCLCITRIADDSAGMQVDWQGGLTASQIVEYCTDIGPGPVKWYPILTNLPPTVISRMTDSPRTNRVLFYRIRIP